MNHHLPGSLVGNNNKHIVRIVLYSRAFFISPNKFRIVQGNVGQVRPPFFLYPRHRSFCGPFDRFSPTFVFFLHTLPWLFSPAANVSPHLHALKEFIIRHSDTFIYCAVFFIPEGASIF